MPRVLIISEEWLRVGGTARDSQAAFTTAVADAGFSVDVITSGEGEMSDAGISELIPLPLEPQRDSGFLFGLRNALFFDTPANPANYSLLRDRLHMHLQDVLYDAVVIRCPPPVYLRLGYWIDEIFGIPVWIHITAAMAEPGWGAFARWNHRRLRNKYFSAAKLVTAETEELLRAVPVVEHQLRLTAISENNLRFASLDGASYTVHELLRSINRKQS